MPTLTRGTRDCYLELVGEFLLTSIRDEDHLREAQEVMDKILSKPKPRKGELEYLDALSDLVWVYEDVHHSIDAPTDAALLLHLMEARDVSQTTLQKGSGIALSTISEVLAGKRQFTKSMISKLSKYFGVDKGLFASNF